jgi:hypothetical protein
MENLRGTSAGTTRARSIICECKTLPSAESTSTPVILGASQTTYLRIVLHSPEATRDVMAFPPKDRAQNSRSFFTSGTGSPVIGRFRSLLGPRYYGDRVGCRIYSKSTGNLDTRAGDLRPRSKGLRNAVEHEFPNRSPTATYAGQHQTQAYNRSGAGSRR